MTRGTPSTIEYYEAFELALSALTATGEYRRHFGSSSSPAPAGYCWFKGLLAPERHPEFTQWLRNAGTALEDRLLSELPRLAPRHILDVGCGNGALLQRLAREAPQASLTGVNFQPAQVAAARRLLRGTSAVVVEADFLEHDFGAELDLVCLVESAFHFSDKQQLCQRIARALRPGGEVWLIDIVVAERAAAAFESMGGPGALFNFVPREQWQRCFAACGLRETEFVDFSQGASEVLQISDLAVLKDDYLAPRLTEALRHAPDERRGADFERSLELMVGIVREYRRLSRLLRGGMLQYVLMRYAR